MSEHKSNNGDEFISSTEKKIIKDGDPKQWKSIVETFKNLAPTVKREIEFDNNLGLSTQDLKGSDPYIELTNAC